MVQVRAEDPKGQKQHALKGQKLLAQGIALGTVAVSKAPCKGKSFVIFAWGFKAFALSGRQTYVHDYPGRCPGLGASALSGRVELTCETRIIMTQDTSIYYVWIGGSCDYGLGERGIRDSVLWRKQSRIIMMKLNNTKSECFM